MDNNYVIMPMTKAEMQLAIDWAAKEGWNPGLHDGECFYQTDPTGFFVGKLDGKIIAIGSAVRYDEAFAFCGFYIVDPNYRGQDYGLRLTKHRLAYVGQRNAGIDGVISMLDKYERLGYKLAHNNARYRGIGFQAKTKTNPAILPLATIDFALLSDYDRRHFPARREGFLQCWINQPGVTSLAYLSEGKLAGYGVLRPCREGYKIGPLFADNAKIADELFLKLIAKAANHAIFLDIPESNNEALALVKRYQMEKIFATARMYLREQPPLPLDEIYGITSFELG